jgi:hypothetical protein
MRFFVAIIAAASAFAGGVVQGSVMDPGIYPPPRAIVRVLPQSSGVTKYRFETSQGKFKIENVSAGVYVLRAYLAGFRESAITVAVRDGEITDTGNILLSFAGCDVAICDSVTPQHLPPDVARGDVILRPGCGVDLDKVIATCPSGVNPLDNRADLKLDAGQESAVYLTPINGAVIVGCESKSRSDQRIRIDGLGPGNDWCVETNAKHHSHVFIELKVVEPGADEVALLVITRK